MYNNFSRQFFYPWTMKTPTLIPQPSRFRDRLVTDQLATLIKRGMEIDELGQGLGLALLGKP